ncbi:hypothetical protein BDV27DRAFT_140882 [Aspergillus caelatus]|uniref:Short-chain dehydrogenase/reductase n=1 Tax=Aspergillus caelatus TaxID=61420 RepID=A0A5N7AJN6_9EURO|nr:uncharacterized protein BDV27DRAFT_140882 [Aspergillus caelatus]KAE8369985.1 hypothetical protein BDV27DRAFT_140882 [Aspergillus caelatus]
MVSITTILDSNSNITHRHGPGLVAVFVGGTSGIGESTARAFIRNTDASRAYLIGRDQERAMRIIEELKQKKPDSEVTFIKSNVSLLREVDKACAIIREKENRVNILFLSPGTGSMNGRTETDEGLDEKLNLHYYSRMRFVKNLLPQLLHGDQESRSKDDKQSLSRVVSVLEAGGEAALQLNDLSLKTHWSLRNCAKHSITMNSVAMEHLASVYPQISFVHSFPGVVRTRLDRDLSTTAKYAISALMVLAKPWEIPFEESGERHLYAATSPRFPSRAYRDSSADAAEGSDGRSGSGFYRLNAQGSPYKPSKIMETYRAGGTRSLIWDHTLSVFAQVRDEQKQDP